MAKIDLRNPPNEMPDTVGSLPANPILASFRPFIPPRARLRELTPLPLIIGTLLGMVFGESIIGVVISAIVVFSGVAAPLALVGPGFETAGIVLGGLAFAVTAFILYRWILRMGSRSVGAA